MIDCPALHLQSHLYPKRYKGRVPARVRILKGACACIPGHSQCVRPCEEHQVWVNSHGAVAAVLPDGQKLGLRPDEFEVIEWHEAKQ